MDAYLSKLWQVITDPRVERAAERFANPPHFTEGSDLLHELLMRWIARPPKNEIFRSSDADQQSGADPDEANRTNANDLAYFAIRALRNLAIDNAKAARFSVPLEWGWDQSEYEESTNKVPLDSCSLRDEIQERLTKLPLACAVYFRIGRRSAADFSRFIGMKERTAQRLFKNKDAFLQGSLQLYDVLESVLDAEVLDEIMDAIVAHYPELD